MANIDIDKVYGKLEKLEASEKWFEVTSNDEFSILFHPPDEAHKALSHVRLDYEMEVPLEYRVQIHRPEYQSFQPKARWPHLEISVLHVIAPGDAIAFRRSRDEGQGFDQAMRLIGAASQSESGHKVRQLMRRDFPRPGACCGCLIPLNNDDRLVEEHGALKAYFLLFEESIKGPSFTRCSMFIEIPWSSPPKWIEQVCQKIVSFHKAAGFNDPSLPLQIESEEFYQILNYRSCARGAPLLPIRSSNATSAGVHKLNVFPLRSYLWEVPLKTDFKLADYLREFLALIGIQAAVYDTLDGGILVPYQAVILGSEWKKIEAQFEAAFREQRAAFRHFYGGSAAPKVLLCSKPRFLPRTQPQSPSNVYYATTNNTFVDIIDTAQLKSFQSFRCPAEYH